MKKHGLILASVIFLLTGFAGYPALDRLVSPPHVRYNDNNESAGTIQDDFLSVDLEAVWAQWNPLDPDARGSRVVAFSERGEEPVVPAPLIRASVGTTVRVTITNHTDSTLVVHGLSERVTSAMDSLVVGPQSTGRVEFTMDAPGTYYYRGVTTADGSAMDFQDNPLVGALVVDEPGDAGIDKIMVMGVWHSRRLANGRPAPGSEFLWINGRPWPLTERLAYDVGDSVSFRLINASRRSHPMHLHGFFFRVDSRGDIARDTIYWPDQRRMAVTENMRAGTTARLTWSPDRPGGWIFHCHLSFHVGPNGSVLDSTVTEEEVLDQMLRPHPEHHDPNTHVVTGMGGLMMGMYIRPPDGWVPPEPERRKMRLFVTSDSTRGNPLPEFSYVLQQGNIPPADDSILAPASPLILHRGEPTSVMIINRSGEATQIHWHGLEIESYYDGVAGFSGYTGTPTPAIMPGDSFEMRITPPRAGSYMYHTHVMDIRQQARGLYGAFIVLDSAEVWDPAHDLTFITGNYIMAEDGFLKLLLNGSRTPGPLQLTQNDTYRLRLMNITLAAAGLRVRLVREGMPVRWKQLAKDGWELDAEHQIQSWAETNLSIGETKDYSFTPPQPGEYTLELRSGRGRLQVKQTLIVAAESGDN